MMSVIDTGITDIMNVLFLNFSLCILNIVSEFPALDSMYETAPLGDVYRIQNMRKEWTFEI